MRWTRGIYILVGFAGYHACAHRSDGVSICDYYAAERYGANNATTQLLLMQGIIAYAYAGGNSTSRASSAGQGIFNRGSYANQNIYLRPWFDGSKQTSNSNGVAVGINWMDGGGLDPLLDFLNGTTAIAQIKPGTNQFKLFTHWYYVFGRIFLCSRYREFIDQKFEPLNPAYVHKFMDLNEYQVGYFIEQLATACRYYGFSPADTSSVVTFMGGKYNYRCLPPDNGQLTSICLAKDCPLAVPSANCNVYENVQARGVESSAAPSNTAAASSSAATGEGSSSDLSGGAIAGIAIGGTAVALLAVGVWLFFRRQRRSRITQPVAGENNVAPPASWVPPSPYGSNMSPSPYYQNPHESYMGSIMTTPSEAWAVPKPMHELGDTSPEISKDATHPAQQTPDKKSKMDHVAEMDSSAPQVGLKP